MQLSYPPELPISGQSGNIISAIIDNQVLIIAGDTGSGKTTQIPKMCLEAGRGKNGIIGCTQPRRIAAVSVADRVAEELADREIVGYKIRFKDRTSVATRIKFMTDGILLAEKAKDRNFNRYDTIIIDEAHERSLNIDFLLGYIKTLLVRRPDLKLIIASATIDTEKFSSHFDNAPIINVSGRTYPITTEYIPHDEPDYTDAETYVDQAAQEAIHLTGKSHGGDILIFMPTERDILDCADMLKKKSDQARILPLFGRLQASDQKKIFRPDRLRKIIVATNVAETSITVPGIRYVIDTGLARIARYNPRTRTTSLKVAKISRASCDQRTGRCGRTGPGHCIRLYGENEYQARSEFTQPEIQRSNLAEVILQMISLRLGDPRDFPFIDPPTVNSIRDGYKVLAELGAITPNNKLTSHGKIMARLPLDPCISRIIIEAADLGATREIKVIAAGLSIQDPRIRPADKEEKADEIHRRFVDKKSDFLSLLSIWDLYHETAGKVRSRSKLKKFCSSHFLSWQRMREWLDIHEQISDITKNNKKFRDNSAPASYEAIHQALLSGFLRNIGQKIKKNTFRVRGNREVMIFPGSGLFNRGGQWIMSSAFMETSRLYAINAAVIDVRWLEKTGADLCRKSWSLPHWEKKTGQVIAMEKVTLFGLVIVASRKVNYGKINSTTAQEAREIFIRHALIPGDLGGRFPFLQHNISLLKHFLDMESRTRRRDIVFDDEALFRFYDARLGPVFDRHTLKTDIKTKKGDNYLRMHEEDICRAAPDERELYLFPKSLNTRAGTLHLQYRFKPGHAADGITIDIPLSKMLALDTSIFEWLVPGMLKEKVQYLLKSLPKKLRRRLVPLPDKAERVTDDLEMYKGSLYAALEKTIFKQYQIKINRTDWQPAMLPLHLRMRFRLRDKDGKIRVVSRSFEELLECPLEEQTVRPDTKKQVQLPKSVPILTWNFETPPEPLYHEQGVQHQHTIFYPALTINKNTGTVKLQYIEDRIKSSRDNRSGMLFLYCLQFRTEVKALSRECKAAVTNQSASWLSLGLSAPASEIRQLLLDFILLDIFRIRQGTLPDRTEFDKTIALAKEEGLIRTGKKRLDHLLEVLSLRREISSLITRQKNSSPTLNDVLQCLKELLPADFLKSRNFSDLQETARYLKALAIRFERAMYSPAKDAKKTELISHAVNRLKNLSSSSRPTPDCNEILKEYSTMVQEYRVSVFAPELGTAFPVSEKRLKKKWQEVENICLRVE